MGKLSPEFFSLMEAQEAPFVLIGADYRIVAANRAYCEAYGVAAERVVGRTCHEVSHHSPSPCHETGEDCPHRAVFATGKPHQVLHTHYDRHDRPEYVRITGHPITDSRGKRYLGEIVRPIATAAEIDCPEWRMIGKSPAFLTCVDHLSRAAQSQAPILLYGESGVGKELAAHYVHQRSNRRGRAFVAIDCASIPETLFESELFGHERGAFTGCVGRKQGLFEQANNGTLFLDEVGEIPRSIQPKLLRVLETGTFRRVGGKDLLHADVRIVSATHRNLLEMVDQGLFRQDLYYRIAGIDIQLPPLRSRRADIPALAEALLKAIRIDDQPGYRLGDGALQKLMAYHYPGNVRELRNILQRAAALCPNGLIAAHHIGLDAHAEKPAPAAQTASATPVSGKTRRISELESDYIRELLRRYHGHRRTVAELLGISERTLYRKLIRYRLHE